MALTVDGWGLTTHARGKVRHHYYTDATGTQFTTCGQVTRPTYVGPFAGSYDPSVPIRACKKCLKAVAAEAELADDTIEPDTDPVMLAKYKAAYDWLMAVKEHRAGEAVNDEAEDQIDEEPPYRIWRDEFVIGFTAATILVSAVWCLIMIQHGCWPL